MTRAVDFDLQPGNDQVPAEPSEHARKHAHELASRLTSRGLRASAAPLVGSPAGAMTVAAQRVDVHPYAGRLVVLLPGPGDPGELYWHWQRPFSRHPQVGARWFQPFSPADAYDDTADQIAAVIAADLRARARLLHASAARLVEAEEPDGEVLVYVGHRVHALVSRMLERLKAIENDLEDPDLLADLYGIDHLATQLRRAAARSAVLGGRTARRASVPMPMSTVLRQAMAEVEAFQRVRLTLPDDDVEIPGYAGPDVIHILAELVENATRFSGTTVRMVTVQAPGGLGVEVQDEGELALSAERLAGLRRILNAPFQVSLREQVRQGQVGLLVAARLAARHGIRIELRPQSPGMHALVLLPRTLLASPAPAVPRPQASPGRRIPVPSNLPAPPPAHPPPTGPT
ncbi:ATP-binding protein, partial [Actinomadura sp. 7K534]|uniref:ATP-binding protein n=1 Tax=Actinomadura sp. 7K534 TaxID=2530366 RepID=UPI0010D32778